MAALSRTLGHNFSTLTRWGVILLLVHAGWKVVPVYAAALRFEQDVATFARVGATEGQDEGEILYHVLERARYLELPVKPENVRILNDRAEKMVLARLEYHVAVDLGYHELRLKFRANLRERALLTQQDLDQMRRAVEY